MEQWKGSLSHNEPIAAAFYNKDPLEKKEINHRQKQIGSDKKDATGEEETAPVPRWPFISPWNYKGKNADPKGS